MSNYLDASPVAGLGWLTQDEVDIRILTHEEEAALIAPMPDRPHDLEERAMLICSFDTLQRLGSVTALTWSHDQGTDSRIRNAKVRSGTGAGSVIPLSGRVCAAPMDRPFSWQRALGNREHHTMIGLATGLAILAMKLLGR